MRAHGIHIQQIGFLDPAVSELYQAETRRGINIGLTFVTQQTEDVESMLV